MDMVPKTDIGFNMDIGPKTEIEPNMDIGPKTGTQIHETFLNRRFSPTITNFLSFKFDLNI